MAEIQLPAEILRRGFYFVDTPGLGSVIVENTLTTETFLPEADAFVLVTSYESPLSEAMSVSRLGVPVRSIALRYVRRISTASRTTGDGASRLCVERDAEGNAQPATGDWCQVRKTVFSARIRDRAEMDAICDRYTIGGASGARAELIVCRVSSSFCDACVRSAERRFGAVAAGAPSNGSPAVCGRHEALCDEARCRSQNNRGMDEGSC
jgi:hypothetical protein